MFEQNLLILEQKYPELHNLIKNIEFPAKYEKIGKSIKYNNNLLFSKYSPEQEAESILKKIVENFNNKKELMLFGIGNPYLINKLLNIYNLYIFIPDLKLFKLCLKFFDYTNILNKAILLWDEKNIDFNDIPVVPLKVEEKYFSEKLNKLKKRKKITQPKILIVKPFYGGSLPVINYCEMNLKKFKVKVKSINSDAIFSAYNIISDTLQKKDFISQMRIKLIDFISELVFYSIEEFKPDIIFAVAQAPLNEKILKYIKEKKIISIFWFVEDYKLFTYWRYFAPLYDYYFVIQKENFFQELSKIGVSNYHYLPLACEPSIHKPLNLTEEEKRRFGSTISFVGAGYYNRRKFFQNLLNYDFKIWGSDWENEVVLKDIIQENGRRVTTEETVKIFNASLININLHSSTFYEGIAPDGDFINPRTFEIAACNRFQIVDRRKLLPLHFIEGEEILTFSNITEMKNLIENIIKSPEKYNQIKENSYRKVLSQHTYEHRLKEIASIVGFELIKKGEDYNNDKEFYLENFDSIEDIAEYISKKDKVSYTDTIFLLINELKKTYLN